MPNENTPMSRRAFAALGGAAALSVFGAGTLAGCASGSTETPAYDAAAKGEANAAALFSPMSEEERAAAVADPVYMGAKKNYAGQEIVVAEGPNGGLADKRVIDRNADFEPKLYKVTDRIYCSVGNCISNSTMIIGDTGVIIVDTAENKETAQMDLDQFRTVTDKPVVAVIATHDHYVQGTATYVGDGNPDNIPIIAHQDFMKVKLSNATELLDTVSYRSVQMFGAMLPQSGPDASVSAGMGAFLNNPKVPQGTPGFIVPNTLISPAREKTEMTIDGVKIEFWPLVSDSPATLDMWLPDDKVAITNHVWDCFYNMYTIRGSQYRDPNDTVMAMDTILSWKPEVHVSVHGLPMIGADRCREQITLFRDGVQFVYDQTVRFMNKGIAPDEIVRNVRIPREIIESDYAKPFYGDVEHYVRGVYGGIIGWFGTDAIELHPINKEFESRKLVEALGGVAAVVEQANNALEDGQYAWAATLASHALRADPESAAARNAKAQSYRKMGQVSSACNTRHWYLSNALMLEGNLTIPTSIPADPSMFSPADPGLFMRFLRVNLVPEQAQGVNMSLQFTFTDTDDVVTMSIHNCVAQAIVGTIDSPTVEVKLPYELVGQCVAGSTNLRACIAEGKAELVGNAADLDTILGCFEMPF